MALVKPFAGTAPVISSQVAFLAENATIVGNVTLAEGCSVWYGAVLRGDSGSITVGPETNIQDNAVLHTGNGHCITIGRGVTIGHSAVVHGCTLEDGVLVGMHATVLNGAVVGAGSVIAAGALITEGTVIPPHSLVIGVPGKVRGEVSPAMQEKLPKDAAHYVQTAQAHAAEKPLS